MFINVPQVSQTLDYTCGAACFESMFRYFKVHSPGEMYFAKELGTLKLGMTRPEDIHLLALHFGFTTKLSRGSRLHDIYKAVESGAVVIVTWWDEDAGHYSIVRTIDSNSIVLMDPWTAREGKDNQLTINNFEDNWKARGSVMIVMSDYSE